MELAPCEEVVYRLGIHIERGNGKTPYPSVLSFSFVSRLHEHTIDGRIRVRNPMNRQAMNLAPVLEIFRVGHDICEAIARPVLFGILSPIVASTASHRSFYERSFDLETPVSNLAERILSLKLHINGDDLYENVDVSAHRDYSHVYWAIDTCP